MQGDITRDISNRLRIHLSGSQQQRVGRAGTTNPEAYRLYLEGRQLWYSRTPEGLKKSIDLFQLAIAADPNYALAYTGLADTYNVIPSYGDITSKQAQAMADAGIAPGGRTRRRFAAGSARCPRLHASEHVPFQRIRTRIPAGL